MNQSPSYLDMSYPSDIPVPPSVYEMRSRRLKELLAASFRAMGLRGALILIEMIGFQLFSSHSLLLDALSSLFDLLCSLALVFCLLAAKKPPDFNHPFGHGRIEPVAGLLLSSLIIEAGIYLLYLQITEPFGSQESISPLAALFALSGALLMYICYYLMNLYGRRHQSPAILAEASHYRMDALNSLVASSALATAFFFPSLSLYIDRAGAIVIAIMMIGVGVKAALSNLHQLVDTKPEETFFNKIREAAKSVKGVLETEKIMIQNYGPQAHVDIDIEVEPLMSVQEAHVISQHVRRAIQIKWPQVVDVTVHIEPFFEGDH